MHSDLYELCDLARERLTVPPFPRASIRAAASRQDMPGRVKRRWLPVLIAALPVLAFAAAAELATQSHIHYTKSGGIVLASSGKVSNRAISSDEAVREAAARLNFHAIVPSGLPPGTKPVRLYTSGEDLMVITYDLPGAWRASHHLAWIFLANPETLGTRPAPAARYRLRADGRMSQARWRAGGEEVIVVSSGLTATEVEAVRRAMTSP